MRLLRLCYFEILLIASLQTLTSTPRPVQADIPKNVILFIGDGMGPQQLGLLFLARAHGAKVGISVDSPLQDLIAAGSIALVQPNASGSLVVDSGCAATALAAGVDSLPETVGIDAMGAPVRTILEAAASMGKSTGLVSDTRITHATPAAFYAKVPHRNDENDIAAQLVRAPITVALAGGIRHFLSEGMRDPSLPFDPKPERTDRRNLWSEARDAGFQTVSTEAQLAGVREGKVLGLFAASGMQDAISESKGTSNQPTLRSMTAHALRILDQNPKGFFLMVEAGQIDWAAHANDPGWLFHEMLRADEAVGEILRWMKGRDDTLFVVTADHETGGFGFSYHAAQIPKPVPFPGTRFPHALYQPQYNFVAEEVLARLKAQRRTLGGLGDEWLKREPKERVPTEMIALVGDATGFTLSLPAAQRVVREVPNQYYQAGHKYLDVKNWTELCAYDAFYPMPAYRVSAALARELSSSLGVVWATGNHTSTPVIAAWTGDPKFSPGGLLTSTELGAALMQTVAGTRHKP